MPEVRSLVERYSRAPAMDYDMLVAGVKDPGRAFLSGRQLQFIGLSVDWS